MKMLRRGSKETFLLHRNNRLCLIGSVGDQVVQLLPAFQVQRDQTQLRLKLPFPHLSLPDAYQFERLVQFLRLLISIWAQSDPPFESG